MLKSIMLNVALASGPQCVKLTPTVSEIDGPAGWASRDMADQRPARLMQVTREYIYVPKPWQLAVAAHVLDTDLDTLHPGWRARDFCRYATDPCNKAQSALRDVQAQVAARIDDRLGIGRAAVATAAEGFRSGDADLLQLARNEKLAGRVKRLMCLTDPKPNLDRSSYRFIKLLPQQNRRVQPA